MLLVDEKLISGVAGGGGGGGRGGSVNFTTPLGIQRT